MLCSFVACTIMRLCMENCTAYFTTNNCSEEKGTTTKDLDTFSTRTDGFRRTPPAQIWMDKKLLRKWEAALISHSYDVLFVHLVVIVQRFGLSLLWLCSVSVLSQMETVTSWKTFFVPCLSHHLKTDCCSDATL